MHQRAVGAARLHVPLCRKPPDGVATPSLFRRYLADSDKEVEFFLLNNKIPYQTGEKSYHRGNERRKAPVFTLEGPSGPIRLTIFAPEDARTLPRNALNDGVVVRARSAAVASLLDEKNDR